MKDYHIAMIFMAAALVITMVFMISNINKVSECKQKHNVNQCYLIATPEKPND